MSADANSNGSIADDSSNLQAGAVDQVMTDRPDDTNMDIDEADSDANTDRLSQFSDELPDGDWPDPFGDTNTGADDDLSNDGFMTGQWVRGQFVTNLEPEDPSVQADAAVAARLQHELNKPRYELRGRRNQDLYDDAWVDDDDSGNFDPVAERKALRGKLRAKARNSQRKNQREAEPEDENAILSTDEGDNEEDQETEPEDENAVLSTDEGENEEDQETEPEDENAMLSTDEGGNEEDQEMEPEDEHAVLSTDERGNEEEQEDQESESDEDEDSHLTESQPPQKKRKARKGSKISWHPTASRKNIACDLCRKAARLYRKDPKKHKSGARGGRCSLYKDQSQTIPCEQCKKNKTKCTFSGYDKAGDDSSAGEGAQGGKKWKGKGKASSSKSKLPAGQPRWITTQFCHPITFTYKFSPDSNTSALCDFCRNASTEIYGLGKKTLKVIDPLDGTGYIEAYGGGHLADGLNPTFLCDGCTYARSSIYDCDRFEGEHLIIAMDNKEELEVIASSAKKTAQVMATLDERKAAGKEIKICSICPSIAVYRCATLGDHDAYGNLAGKIDDYGNVIVGVSGCGLHLCETCAGTLAEKNGNLERAIRKARLCTSLTGPYPEGVRADVDFLLEEGLLVRQCKEQIAAGIITQDSEGEEEG